MATNNSVRLGTITLDSSSSQVEHALEKETSKLAIAEKDDRLLWESIKNTCEQINFPNKHFDQFRTRPLENLANVFEQNAWDNVEWDESMKEEAMRKVEKNSTVFISDELKELYDKEASQFWNKFYGVHQNKFFKERNWLLNEFPELQSEASICDENVLNKNRKDESFPGEKSKCRVLEVGCGNGSTVFPLLATNNNPDLYVYCCDFSVSAIEVVNSNPVFDRRRCSPFVWDVASEDMSVLPFPPNSLQFITLIFVLSAISPDKFDQVIQNLSSLLLPGGLILFRDYGVHDLVQLRLPAGRCISENFYVRGDGTRVYFFSKDLVVHLFEKHGLNGENVFVDRRLQVNRIKELKMYRVWVQGKFRKV